MNCKVCNTPTKGSGAIFCSDACKAINKDNRKNLKLANAGNRLTGEENVDYVVCQWCQKKTQRIYGKHILYNHPEKTTADYKTDFPGYPLTTSKDKTNTTKNAGLHMKEDFYREQARQAAVGERNPNHRSKTTEEQRKQRSPFSEKFVRYQDVKNKKEAVSVFVNTALENRLTETQYEYWLNKYDGDETLAKEAYKNRQRTFTLEKCITTHGEKEGIIKWKERQKKWHKNFKKCNFSKISQKLFESIHNEIKTLYTNEDIFYATLEKKVGYKNHEYILDLGNKIIRPDFFIKSINKIIEFDGTYYHRNNPENMQREKLRDAAIIKSGYKVFHVSESDYSSNPEETLKKCLEFLND